MGDFDFDDRPVAATNRKSRTSPLVWIGGGVALVAVGIAAIRLMSSGPRR